MASALCNTGSILRLCTPQKPSESPSCFSCHILYRPVSSVSAAVRKIENRRFELGRVSFGKFILQRRGTLQDGKMGSVREAKQQEGLRAFARPQGRDEDTSHMGMQTPPGLVNYRVWQADNEWLAKHGIPTLEIDETGGLPRLHLNSKLELPLVKLPPSLEWLDLYGEPQINLRKKLAVNLDPFGEPQVKLRKQLAVNLDFYGEPQVKLRKKLADGLDPFGEPQVKLRKKLAVNLDPFGEPQVKLREQLAATLKPPLTKPPTSHSPVIFRPTGPLFKPEVEEKPLKEGQRNPFLEGNFAPVEEECIEEIPCHVIGDLPEDLKGRFLRNGPNPRYPELNRQGYHWFDGDGMVHSLKFQGLDKPPVYSSKYIRTSGFKQEEELGRGKFWPGVRMEPIGRCLLTAAIRSLRGSQGEKDVPGLLAVKNTANTGLVRHAGKLFAMWEGGHPYVLDDSLDTKGPSNFDGRLLSSFSAHPKLDPETGELIYFGYSLVTKPYLSYGVISKEGEIVHQQDIDLPHPVMMHDFAITEHYSLFLDFPFFFQPERMMRTNNGKREKAFVFDGTIRGRIGVLPRFGTARDLQWFSVGPGMVLHVLNAFEELVPEAADFLNGALSGKSEAQNLRSQSQKKDKTAENSSCFKTGKAEDGQSATAKTKEAESHRSQDQKNESAAKKSRFFESGRAESATSEKGEPNRRLGVTANVKQQEKKPVIVLRAMHYHTFTGLGLADVALGTAATCPENAYLHEWRLDLETGHVQERQLSNISADFPVIDGSRQGRYNRYGYMSRFVQTSASICEGTFGCNITPLFDGLIKVDLETGTTQVHDFGPKRLGGEAVFVPRPAPVQSTGFEEILDQLPSYILDFLPPGAFNRPQSRSGLGFGMKDGSGLGIKSEGESRLGFGTEGESGLWFGIRDEDEGWLVTHVWNEALQQSEVLIIDAKTFEGPPVARVILPGRVPFGFHGTFLPEEENEDA